MDQDMLKEITLDLENGETIAEYYSPILPLVGHTIHFGDKEDENIFFEVLKVTHKVYWSKLQGKYCSYVKVIIKESDSKKIALDIRKTLEDKEE